MSSFTVSNEIEVRFRDTDPMGHVNNAVYLTYLEVARQEYWKKLGGDPDYQKVPFVLAHVRIDFRDTAKTGDLLRLGVRTHWIGRGSFGMQYQITDAASDRVVAEAESVQVTYDYGVRKSMPIPEALRRRIERLEGRPLPDRQPER